MITGIGIHIKVKEFEKSVAFYRALGFKKTFEYGPNKKVKEDYSGMVFEAGSARIEVADGHRAVKEAVFKEFIKSSKISLMVNVPNLSGIMKRININKLKIAVGPRHYYWGTLELVVKDPDGLVIVFIAPYSLKEAKKLQVDETYASHPE